MKNYNKDWFMKHDEPGNCILSAIGFDENNVEICYEFLCDKDDCNCKGHWRVGDEKNIETWIGRV